MTAHEIEWKLSEVARISADMIDTAMEVGGPINMWMFELTLDMHRNFLRELAQDERQEAQLIAKRAKEVLESAIAIATNPNSRASRRLVKRMERCLDSINKHLPALLEVS
jgi:hypothetical protein